MLNLSLVFNLVNNIDVDATKERIDQYKRANEDVIARNRLQQQAEEKTLEMTLENEREEFERRREEDLKEAQDEQVSKRREREEYIEALVRTDASRAFYETNA